MQSDKRNFAISHKRKISIRNAIQIFETIADEEMISRNGPLNLYEKVRLSIAPDIVAPLIENNYLKVLRLNQKLSEYLLENGNEIINYYVCEKELIESFSREYNEKRVKLNTTPVVICASSIRHIVKAFFHNNCHIKNVTVISDTEVASTIEHFGNMILEIISDLGENTIIPEKKLTEEKPAPINYLLIFLLIFQYYS